ncbi:sugar 3,4-ketoisomerase [Bacteroidetes bacterium endosymbiont of Geopemphigus sp.]|uniref:sugar 3,4-ketoisomerase n=1 Tax=Bacteroidetes bacterium endosymbiont of Geopemphigus sp. TaxID=2047937 RepID=UPI0018A7F95E|nr:FdtA/QdtA family cupin domain-containing protein [Bacteroidetes bacterium endosymbiont of Geopemphigus sp.]
MNGIKTTELPKKSDIRGRLSFFENEAQIPFKIRSISWFDAFSLKNLWEAHALLKSWQFIVVLSGSLELKTHDGKKENGFVLNRPDMGICIPPNIWINYENSSQGTIILIVSENSSSEESRIKDFNEFKKNALS